MASLAGMAVAAPQFNGDPSLAKIIQVPMLENFFLRHW